MDTEFGALNVLFTEFYYWVTVVVMFLIHVGFLRLRSRRFTTKAPPTHPDEEHDGDPDRVGDLFPVRVVDLFRVSERSRLHRRHGGGAVRGETWTALPPLQPNRPKSDRPLDHSRVADAARPAPKRCRPSALGVHLNTVGDGVELVEPHRPAQPNRPTLFGRKHDLSLQYLAQRLPRQRHVDTARRRGGTGEIGHQVLGASPLRRPAIRLAVRTMDVMWRCRLQAAASAPSGLASQG